VVINAWKPRCVNPIGYVRPTRSASFRTDVNNVVTRFEGGGLGDIPLARRYISSTPVVTDNGLRFYARRLNSRHVMLAYIGGDTLMGAFPSLRKGALQIVTDRHGGACGMQLLGFVMAGMLMVLSSLLAEGGQSPYAGQEQRDIKALSGDDIEALRNGQEQGQAKTAELNQFPGPKHVLELASSLQLSEAQGAETQRIYDAMHAEAVHLGALIIDKERDLDSLFSRKAITSEQLQTLGREIARLQGGLRIVHLQAHLEMVRVLTPTQLDQYNELRGYQMDGPAMSHEGGHHGNR
jgi:hypothetical protein